MGNYILNDDGEPVAEPDVIKWAHWFETAERHVGKTQFGDVLVSTVFLGTDHNFGEPGPPILWETMIFGLPYEPEYQERYATRKEAEAGHQVAVAIARKRMTDDD